MVNILYHRDILIKNIVMKEVVEFRIFDDYYHLLPKPNTAKFNGIVYVIRVLKDDPLFRKIGELNEYTKKKYNHSFYSYYKIRHFYTDQEIANACLLQIKIKSFFEPAGEDCGTRYDESDACEICGCNRNQIGPLKLKKGSIPKKDIAESIGGDVVVSKHFMDAVKFRGLKGICLTPVEYGHGVSDYYQLSATENVVLTPNTIAGVDPFDTTTTGNEAAEFVENGHKIIQEKEVFVCPKGHLIGLNLLSEGYVYDSPLIGEYDFFASQQRIGVRRGVFYPEPLYFCSPAFKRMVEEEHLTGFGFEVAHVEER